LPLFQLDRSCGIIEQEGFWKVLEIFSYVYVTSIHWQLLYAFRITKNVVNSETQNPWHDLKLKRSECVVKMLTPLTVSDMRWCT